MQYCYQPSHKKGLRLVYEFTAHHLFLGHPMVFFFVYIAIRPLHTTFFFSTRRPIFSLFPPSGQPPQALVCYFFFFPFLLAFISYFFKQPIIYALGIFFNLDLYIYSDFKIDIV